jgi:hypothetical protein
LELDVFDAAIAKVEAAVERRPHLTHHRTLRVPPWEPDERSTGLAARYAAAAAELGLETATEVRGGGSDANWLWERYPVLDGLGPSGYNAHCCKPAALGGGGRRNSLGDVIPDGDMTYGQEYAEWSSFSIKAAATVLLILDLVGEDHPAAAVFPAHPSPLAL